MLGAETSHGLKSETHVADMDTSSPQLATLSRQTNSAREIGRPLKLRSSCDTCSNAKVKCDRQRPACQRCVNVGVWCNYSVSRRMGKPAGSGQRGGSKAQKKTPSVLVTPDREMHRTVLDATTLSQTFPAHFVADVGSSIPGFGHSTTLPWMDFDLMSDGYGYPSSHPSEGLPSTPALLPFNGSMGFVHYGPPAERGIDPNCTGSWESSTHLGGWDIDIPPSYNTQDGQTYQSYSPSPMERYATQTSPGRRTTATCNGITNCNDLASTILQSLHIPSNLCTTSTSDRNSPAASSTVDQVLTTSSRVISSFDTLLQCPCSGNSSLALTLALIILKFLSCNTGAARRSMPCRTPSSSSLASPFQSPSSSSTYRDKDTGIVQDTVLDAPVMTGSYQPDAEDEHHTKLQLFLSELRNVSKLVDAFAARYCQDWAERGTGDGNSDDGLYSALETLLRKEWRSAVKEVVTVLRGEDGVVTSAE